MTTRIKICGVRTPEIAGYISRLGVDALGLVFYDPSRRAVTVDQAGEVVRAAAPLVTTVGLFVNPRREEVAAVLEACALDCLQFHGDESAVFCEQFARPYIKAISMRPDVDVHAIVEEHRGARAFLFDSWREDMPGGTGETFDWRRLPELPRPWLLAGGLTAANVGDAIARVRAPAVDVSGGVENAAGEKDPALIRQFVQAVRDADRTLTNGEVRQLAGGLRV